MLFLVCITPQSAEKPSPREPCLHWASSELYSTWECVMVQLEKPGGEWGQAGTHPVFGSLPCASGFVKQGQYSRSQETVLNIKKCVRLTQCLISKNCPINYSLGSDNQNIWLHLGVEMCSVGEKASVNFQTWACVQGYLSTHLVNSKIGNDVRRGKTDKVSHGFYFFILKNLQPTVRNRFYIVP